MAKIIKSFKIPDELQREIFEFLDYKLRCGVYIMQIPKQIYIYTLLLERKEITENLYISFDIDFKDYHNDFVVKTLEIQFSPEDRNIFIKTNKYYAIDYDERRYEIEPVEPW